MKISSLKIENVKRVRAVELAPSETGLTVIGGNNAQGKTSILDAIAFALGGKRHAPTNLKRDGSAGDPFIHIEMDNGLIVERKGKSGALKVTDPTGAKAGQALLDEFVSELAIDLPSFMKKNDRQKADDLLSVLGIGDKLLELDCKEKSLYEKRHDIGVVSDQKLKHLREMPSFDGVPDDIISVADLLRQQQEMLERNARNKILREKKDDLLLKVAEAGRAVTAMQLHLKTLQSELADAEKAAENLEDEDVSSLEQSISEAESLNAKIRANLDKAKAEEDWKVVKSEYDSLTADIECVRADRTRLLDEAQLPLDGLSVCDGALIYKGQRWDCMSGSEQLRVAVAVASAMNRKCGFVLLDELEKFDKKQLEEFGEWLQEQGLQAICTRVSTGDECSILIEDGLVAAHETPAKPKFTPGQF